MFGARLWISLIFSVAFAGLVHCKTNLKCNYYQYEKNYACQVFGEKIQNEHEVVSFSGDHLRRKNDNSVSKLAFYQSTIQYIPTNLFSKFNNMQRFECEACYLKKIQRMDFKNAGKLKTLRLRTGSIGKLQNETFYYCHDLESLNLQANMISEIELKAFKGLRHLKELHLQNNIIRSVTPGMFDDLINLSYLNLFNNKIKKLDAGLFKYNKNLNTIYVHYNKIAVLDPNLISHLDKLTDISFRHNDCGDRAEFLESRPAQIQSTFNKYAPQCTEENRLENKFNAKLAELEKLKDDLVKKNYDNNQCEIKVSQLTQELDKNNKLDKAAA
jgi:Leucine-rich repeat (LRR) protein